MRRKHPLKPYHTLEDERMRGKVTLPNPRYIKHREHNRYQLGLIAVYGWNTVVTLSQLCAKDFPKVATKNKKHSAYLWCLFTIDKIMQREYGIVDLSKMSRATFYRTE